MRIWETGAVVATLVAAALLARATALAANYDDPAFCSSQLAGSAQPLSPDLRRRCVIAIAGAYLDAEADPALAAKVPLADDAVRRVLGRPGVRAPGGRTGIMAALSQSIVASIKNRTWSVEGDVAYVLYDAALQTNPKPVPYQLGERITIEKGQIAEILILAANGVQ